MSEPFVLASGSPRRKEILENLGLQFSVHVADVDESVHDGESPLVYATRTAQAKALAVRKAQSAALLAADTIVVCDGHILGKPRNPEHATETLSRLAGRWHSVTTAVCVLAMDGTEHARAVHTDVRFRQLTPQQIARYVATGEGADKAGSYGIQRIGSGLVSEIRGSYTNVVGLPAVEALELLSRADVVGEWP